MQLNMFAYGFALRNDSYIIEQKPERLPSVTSPIAGSFSTNSLLQPWKPAIILTNQMNAIGIEDYRANANSMREQAILRAATSTIRIGRNEDGSIWTESISDPEAALANKRATGGDSVISWKHVDFNLQTHGMMIGETTLDEVGQQIDYFASEYAQYKSRIERQFTGEEQATELAKLDDMFAQRVGESANHFAESVGGFLEASGVPGEQEAIRSSFLDIYEQRKTTYMQFIQENPDYASVEGTRDEWLLTAGDFMGEQLRYALNSQQSEMSIKSENGYSIDDLQAAGTMVKALTQLQDRSQTSNRSEEELGFKLGLAAMKYEMISGHFQVSDRIKSKLDQAFGGFIQGEIDRAVAYIEQQRKDPFVRNKEAYAADYDKKAVLSLIKQMVDNVRADDVNAAFRSDLNTFVALYKNKMNDMQSGQLARYNAYTSAWVNQNYASDWNRFIHSLSSTNQNDLNRFLLKDQVKLMDISV
ncbi:hypothetical protein [Paenibacillus camerounensis]|uniref:hypothetical protein n=1 Tax=Paenibacillus camerounensis TaxID=1243663 RepID=UPI0005A7A871|nr:hypothetical protein [Paenibacillus camerounensis]